MLPFLSISKSTCNVLQTGCELRSALLVAACSCSLVRQLSASASTFVSEIYVSFSVSVSFLSTHTSADSLQPSGSQAMSRSAVLERLDVRNNQLGDEGAEAIALALTKKCPVKSLDLASNGLTEKGAKALAAALESNKKLLMLDVRGNNIGEGGVSALQAACRASGVVGRQVLVPSFD